MLKEVEIRRGEEIYQNNLVRAKETAQLGAEIREAFQRHKYLGGAELKKLGRIEKLVRFIRNEAGGDDDAAGLKEQPEGLEPTLNQLAELCEDFRKKVEKTPRHVVSAAVINAANKLILLTRLVRTLVS